VNKKEHKKRLLDEGIFPVLKIDNETISELKDWIVTNRPERKKFTILINSTGGCPTQVVRFASLISILGKEVEITGVALDTCGSAALALLQCCHKRVAVVHTGFFIHHIQTRIRISCHSKELQKIFDDEIESSRLLEEEIVKLQCKKTGLSRDKWMKLADYGEKDMDTPIFTDQALKLGLVDEVVDSYPCL